MPTILAVLDSLPLHLTNEFQKRFAEDWQCSLAINPFTDRISSRDVMFTKFMENRGDSITKMFSNHPNPYLFQDFSNILCISAKEDLIQKLSSEISGEDVGILYFVPKPFEMDSEESSHVHRFLERIYVAQEMSKILYELYELEKSKGFRVIVTSHNCMKPSCNEENKARLWIPSVYTWILSKNNSQCLPSNFPVECPDAVNSICKIIPIESQFTQSVHENRTILHVSCGDKVYILDVLNNGKNINEMNISDAFENLKQSNSITIMQNVQFFSDDVTISSEEQHMVLQACKNAKRNLQNPDSFSLKTFLDTIENELEEKEDLSQALQKINDFFPGLDKMIKLQPRSTVFILPNSVVQYPGFLSSESLTTLEEMTFQHSRGEAQLKRSDDGTLINNFIIDMQNTLQVHKIIFYKALSPYQKSKKTLDRSQSSRWDLKNKRENKRDTMGSMVRRTLIHQMKR